MKKLLVSIAALAALGLSSVASAEMVLNRGGGDNPGSLDPHQISGTWESDIARDQFMGLYTEAADGSIIPGAALSHTVSDDGLTYTFKLRAHNWSDGTPVTAGDFEFAFKRILDPATAADYAYLMHIITGGADYNGGEGSVDAVGVKALDDMTLEVTLASPAPYFIAQTTHNTAYPVPKHAVEKFGGDWARPENIIVNGAFKVDNWVIGEKLTVKKNPMFYDAANVALDAVNYFPIKEETAELNLYREGGLDVTYNMPADIIDEIKAEFGDEVMITPYGGTYYYSFNATAEPFNNADVRSALSMTIDRDFITTVVNTSGIVPAYSFVPTSLPGYQAQNPSWASKSYDERVAMAKDLLAGAGYGNDNPLKIQLRYNTNEGHKNIALAVSDMWAKLGVEVELFNTDARTHYDDLQKQDFQVGRAGWIWDYPDAENLLALMASGKSYNYGQYSNAEFDALLEASYTQSGQERIETMQKAEAIAMEEAALAPIYYYNSKHLVASYVNGYVANGDDRHPSRWISVSE